MLAARAALAAAATRAAQALHTTVHGDAHRSEPHHDSMPAGRGLSARAQDGWLVSSDADTPADVQAELEKRMKQLEQDTESAAVDAHKLGDHKRRQTEQSLWLSGKSRQAMTNYNDVQYVSFLEVGQQTLSGILDTGSFELVVFSTSCGTCGQAARYNPDLSANYTRGQLATVLSYGSGDTFVQEAWDTVSIGPYPPRRQSFWEVTSAKMQVLQYSAFQSIIGIGPPETPVLDADELLQAAIDNVSNYTAAGLPVPSDLQSAVEDRRKVSAALRTKSTMVDTFGVDMYSVCLGKKPGSDGYLVWSDTAPLVKPEYFQRLRMTGNHTWSTSLDEPKFEYDPAAKDRQFDRGNKYHGRTLGCENGCGALLDTGTSILAMPSSVLAELYKVMYEPGFNCSNLWELPSIKIQLGGREVILPPDTYVSEVFDSDAVPGDLQSFVRLRHLGRLRSAKGQASQQLGHSRGSESQRPGASCDFAVMESVTSSAHGPLWILGVPFFRQYYTTFEVGGHSNERRAVHFARASDACTPSASEGFDQFVPKTQLYSRLIHPSKLWVPPSVLSALGADYVNL